MLIEFDFINFKEVIRLQRILKRPDPYSDESLRESTLKTCDSTQFKGIKNSNGLWT